jgi:CDI immunity proteins
MNSKSIISLFDTSATLERLENDFWGKPSEGVTRLVSKSHELRKKKLEDFEPEDFRLLIGQNIGLQFLIPLAISILQKNPFIEGDFHEGDLLQNVLQSNKEFWNDHPDFKREVVTIFEDNKTILLEELDVTEEIKTDLLKAYDKFIEK